MSFKLIKKLDSGIRIGELTTAHGKIETPFFMPVGTVGSVKSVSPAELEDLGAQIVLSNTYHLYLRPGEQLINELGGLHRFMHWDKPILTDSGGYQVFSLAKNNFQFSISNFKSNSNDQLGNDPINEKCKMENGKSQSLVKVTEHGVEFKSHLDGSSHFFTPEKVIDIQLDLGVDILMPLDVCPSGKASRKEVEEAVRLTIEWAKRSKLYFEQRLKEIGNEASIVEGQTSDVTEQRNGHRNRETLPARPLLHGIIQGGLYEDLRRECAKELIALDFDGYSVGGLAVDFETRDMWDIVKLLGEILPEDKQRYLMGVGTPDDIIHATQLGMDMFDCVLPTRLARHGSIYIQKSEILNPKSETNFELVNLLNSKYRADGGVIDENCGCPACRAPVISNNCEVSSESPHVTKGDQKGTGFSRAYISHLLRSKEILGLHLATLHNLYQYLELMRNLRKGQ